MNDGLLQISGLRFAYEAASAWRLAVDTLSLGGERMVCLVGPNGSGKSTLLRIMAGILLPQEGHILLGGADMRGMSRAGVAAKIGYLPQEAPALFDLTVYDVATMGRYVHGAGWGGISARDEAAVSRALEAVDLLPLQKRRLSQVSGGERRRALIASVLAQEPEVLLLDEPTSALDIHHAAELMRLLASFRPPEPAVVVVTHDINLASLFADRLLLLQGGQVVNDGGADMVITAESIRSVYGEGFLVECHPKDFTPFVVPVREVPCEVPGRQEVCDAI